MARGGNYQKQPNNLYFLEWYGWIYGPYTKKPTLLQKKYENSTLLEYKLDENKNYIKINT